MISSHSIAQSLITIPSGTKIEIDGKIEKREWMDADSLTIKINGLLETVVLYKHDSENIYVGYVFKKNKNIALCFPELFFDTNHDKSGEWFEDDLWFHVSGTDCDVKGKHSDYSNCESYRRYVLPCSGKLKLKKELV